MAQPPENLDPDDTEAIIAAFLDDAASHQWGDEEVNQVLEQILQADAAHQAGETPPPLQQATPVPAPFHGPNSPISTPTQPEEEGEEEEPTDDDEVAADLSGPANVALPQGGQNTEEGETSTVHTGQGTTT